jgi:L-asparaginase II
MAKVEVLRGEHVESVHYGTICAVNAKGKVVFQSGHSERNIFPRSAIKALQALPLIETGAAARFSLTSQEIALAVSSHGGEERHTQTAVAMLQKAGYDENCLECGVHHPMNMAAAYALAKAGKNPSPLHNNCSGKHAGFICLAQNEAINPKNYVQSTHKVQQRITMAMSEMIGVDLSYQKPSLDGCSIPAYSMPIHTLAHGFAKFASGEGLSKTRAQAAKVIRDSVAENPFYVAGTDRFCTQSMEILRGKAFVKTGAEGVFCLALPSLGIGVALKCDDGSTRAAEVMAAYVLQKLLVFTAEEENAFQPLMTPILKNWEGKKVGSLRYAL